METQRNSNDHKGEERWHAVFVYDDREFPDPDPDPDPEMSVDQVKNNAQRLLRGDRQRLGEGEPRGASDTIYEFQRRVGTKGAFPHALSELEERVTDEQPRPLPSLLSATPLGGPQTSSSSRRSSHGPTAPSTWTPRPSRQRRRRRWPASRRRTTRRPRAAWLEALKCATAAPTRN